MKKDSYKVTINPTNAYIFTSADYTAMSAFHEIEAETIRDAFIALNRLYNGEPLKVSAEFCKNARAVDRLSKNGLDVWLDLWTLDTYNNRVINVQAYLTDTFDITDSEQGRELIKARGIEHIYNLRE
mgnify:CR=1 FL=1